MKVVSKMTMKEGSRSQRYKQTRRTYGWWIALLLVVVWIVIIWSMSAQSYQQQNIQPWLHRLSQKVHIGFTLPDVQFRYSGHEYSLKQRPYDFVEFLFRKTAHLLVYAVLGVLVYGGLRYKRVRMITCIAVALMMVLVIASIDEYIQQFSPNRTSSIYDVGVDLIGGSCGIAVYLGIRALLGRKQN